MPPRPWRADLKAGPSSRRVLQRALTLFVWLLIPGWATAQSSSGNGREMYMNWCATCHAENGTGRGADRPVKVEPLDFTDCRTATSEPDSDWEFVITRGGQAAGLSSDMPEFGVLGADEVRELVRYVRSFCRDDRWPSGNLNFVRPVFSGKAFPEGELSIRPMVAHGTNTNIRASVATSYAFRVGRRASLELGMPTEVVDSPLGPVWGIGDLSVEAKYTARADTRRSMISSVGLEVTFPTGQSRWGFGEGVTVFEPFVATGFTLGDFQAQVEVRGLLPTRRFPFEPVRYVSWGGSIIRPLTAGPATWALGVELTGVDFSLGVAPQVVFPLARSGALHGAVGVRLPAVPPRPQASDIYRWAGYLLWDYTQPIRRR